jgi:hypothetical protein
MLFHRGLSFIFSVMIRYKLCPPYCKNKERKKKEIKKETLILIQEY